ncbi:MAG: hypothetical protein DWQ40_00110 [Actinobacteria bacterium]|nr:MAG: hypothetical protein DWQ40_00110 [Actinomycetota bacterium]REK33546.1 MAG: hypothetical protein DWQ20_07600 [Actinomycetota bacterium]
MSLILGLIFPILVVAGVIIAIRAFSDRTQERSEGGDLVAYILLALFVGGLVWALFLLGRAAFPGDDLVGTTRNELAGALAGLIVAGPLTYYLWQRQDDRRNRFPDSVGWSLYLALTDLVYLTWLVVYAVQIIAGILGAEQFPRFTDVIIIATVVGVHEWASRVDQPGGNISQIHRIVGSFIGLATLATGVTILLYSLFEAIYSSFAATAGEGPWEVAVGLTLVGAGVWSWRWLQEWTQPPDGTRLTYLVLVCYSAFLGMVITTTSIAVITLTYFLDSPDSAGAHFESLTVLFPILITAGLIWWHHRPRLGTERTDSIRSYEYLLMATGLVTAIGTGTSLAAVVFQREVLVDNLASTAVALVLAFAAAALVWWLFWTNAQEAPRAEEASSFPRRFYLIGMAILVGLTAAGAVVAVLFYIFQLLFDLDPEPSTLVVELTLALLAGGATYHLYREYKLDSGLRTEAVGKPYSVTVICSHPGPLSEALPKEARLKVIHRGDDVGIVDDEIASQIVDATRGLDSIVWVGEHGIQTAPALRS